MTTAQQTFMETFLFSSVPPSIPVRTVKTPAGKQKLKLAEDSIATSKFQNKRTAITVWNSKPLEWTKDLSAIECVENKMHLNFMRVSLMLGNGTSSQKQTGVNFCYRRTLKSKDSHSVVLR